MAEANKFLGFNTTQIKTLQILLSESGQFTDEEVTSILDTVALIEAIPTTAQAAGIVWNDGGSLVVELT